MAGYTRQAAANIVTGSVIDADDFNDEYNQVQSAFNSSTGHTHDGSAGEGAPITTIGPSQDIVATASVLRPKTTNAVDLGTTALQYKDAYFDGTVRTDLLTVDEDVTIAGDLTVNGSFTGSGSTTAARTAISGGNGISYDNSTGVITLNGTPALVGLSSLSSNGNSLTGNLSVSGAITAGGNVTAFSDARLKENVETIEGALDKVSQMRGVMYDKDGERGTGVIAQEMQQVMPEVVMDSGRGDYLSVAYGNIVGVLIEAVKELKAELDEYKSNSE